MRLFNVVKNGLQKDLCHNETGICDHVNNICSHNWEGMYDHGKTKITSTVGESEDSRLVTT